MYYVYLIKSVKKPDERYIGMTIDLKNRMTEHNSGESTHTAKFRPWNLVAYLAFQEKAQAVEFEKYLKSGSGRAFANKRLWG